MRSAVASVSLVVVVVLVAAWPRCCLGHGVPIRIGLSGDRLVVSGGMSDPLGFAPMIFLDGSVDSALDRVTVPDFGDVGLTSLPGFVIRDMQPGTGLNLELLPRPLLGAQPRDNRWLWYADETSETVGELPSASRLMLLSDFDDVELTQAAATSAPTLRVTDVLAEEIGLHSHLLRYMLDDDPRADAGAYGFFARVSSPEYEPSDPFLVVLNLELDEPMLTSAALLINASAQSICGDADDDGDLDSADLVDLLAHWTGAGPLTGADVPSYADGDCDRDGDIDTVDLLGFMASWTGAMSAGSQLSAVPEPHGGPLAIVALALMLAGTRRFCPCRN